MPGERGTGIDATQECSPAQEKIPNKAKLQTVPPSSMQSRWFWRSNRQAVDLTSEVYEWLQVAGKPALPVRGKSASSSGSISVSRRSTSSP